MVHILEKEGKKLGFSRSYRASIDRVQGISFTVPARKIQNDTVAEVERIELQIKAANKHLYDLSEKTKAILDRYLK